MNAEELAIDPVAAAHRLLGATIAGRGVRAMVVEVEAYGGVPDGPWPDAAAHSYRGRNGRNDVMFGPQGGFTPTAAMGSMSVPTSRAGPMARLPLCYLGRRHRGRRRARHVSARADGARCRTGARPGKPLRCPRNHHGRQRD